MEQVIISKNKSPVLWTYTVKTGKKGQITIPKKIRDKFNIKKRDPFMITLMSDGSILLKRETKKIDKLLECIRALPKIDWDKAWKEIEEERHLERS
ncbi:MAG: AbrB/MazE/SpoVT family DNA-binding domain-containing protein [Nanoarchaeota archaeon]